MMASVVIILVFILVTVYIMQPLLLEEDITIEDTQNTKDSFLQRKKILYRQIKELDLDYQLGNVLEQDYINSRNELKKEVSDILSVLNKK
ncbi:MAG: hypothetical protein IIB45_00525 [Candidatus Marinimicrobia bacterium]|nr:hypothetical protein [Candidatus Neomarinimicrobiota bacterium]